MKCVLLSVKPKWVAKILNGKKTIEIRKRFPKDYVGWVYIYCTKAKHYTDLLINNTSQKMIFLNDMKAFWLDDFSRFEHLKMLNGKVIGRFWCDNVEDIACEVLSNGVGIGAYFFTNTYNDIRNASCLNTQDLINYLGAKPNGQIVGKAIHISNLKIFDKTKKISEFKRPKWSKCGVKDKNGLYQCDKCPYGKNWTTTCEYDKPIKAPQNYCYVEVEK